MKIDRVTLALAKKYTDEHGGGGGTSNYNSLTNKPKINNVELSGNKTLEQLGVPLDTSDLTNGAGFITENDIPAIPEKTSDLTNDSGFITKSVDDLTNYTTTSGMNTALSGKVSNSSVGTAGGVAELDNTGKVPSSQLPSYVDDVIDGYYNTIDGKFYEESTYTTEIAGEAGKIYISVDTDLQYRWTGSAFSALGGALVLGETSSTAYRGDRGKAAYDDSQANKTAIGTLSNLNTTEKGNLVGAVNELVSNKQDTMSAGNGITFTNAGKTINATNTLPLNYSTDEQVVGTWIDGKPLYQKTVSCGALKNTGNTTKAHGISNLENVINLYGIGIDPSNTKWYPLPFSYTTAAGNIKLDADSTNVSIITGQDRTYITTTYVTIQYTKTTDT